ncbi:MAG: D-glycero-alpha-D-manno-heptose-1,7-bisphosphate 7-phosphatase [Bacteriovoracia bacterium]
MTNKTPKAIFLDRDGTLIRDKNYLSRVEDIEYFPDTFKALSLLRSKGYRLYVITNQSGVGRGFFTMKEVNVIHRVMDADLKAQGLKVYDGWGVCPHAPHEACSCRKPHPTLIQDILTKEKLVADDCWMLGDKDIDAQCGLNAGINGAIVRAKPSEGDYTFFSTLLEFAESLD